MKMKTKFEIRLVLFLALSVGMMVVSMVTGSSDVDPEDDYFQILDSFVDHDILDINSKSQYCNEMRHRRVHCNFTSTNKMVRFDSTSDFVLLELYIANPRAMLFRPVCVSRMVVYNSSYFTTLPVLVVDAEDYDEVISSGALPVIMNEYLVQCRTWMILLNVTAYDLSHGIFNLLLKNSSARRISLKSQDDFQIQSSSVKHIEWLEWDGYMGKIENSTIETISHISSSKKLLIQGSSITIIKFEGVQFKRGTLNVTNSHIHKIETDGIKVSGGVLMIKNVTVDKLLQHAISVDILTKVKLIDVNITQGLQPVFFFPSRQNVEIENVFIEGEELEYNSSWIEQFDNVFDGEIITMETEQCNETEPTTLECDFSGISRKTFLHLGKLEGGILSVVIRNAYVIAVSNEDCAIQNLTILHSRVSEIAGRGVHNSSGGVNCSSSLHVQFSSITSLSSSAFPFVELKNDIVSHMELINVSSFHFENSSFHYVERLSTKPRSHGLVRNSRIEWMGKMSVKGEINVTNSTVEYVQVFMIENPNGTNSFRNSTFSRLPYHSLRLKSGHFEMVEVLFEDLYPEAFFIGKDATLSINTSQLLPYSARGFLSVSTEMDKSQVNLTFTTKQRKENDWFYTLRESILGEDASFYHFPTEVLINDSHTPYQYCSDLLVSTFCDFQNNKSIGVTVSYRETGPYSIRIANAFFLTIHPLTTTRVALENIANGTILGSHSVPIITMKIERSSFMIVRAGFRELIVDSSSIGAFFIRGNTTHSQLTNTNITLMSGVASIYAMAMDACHINVSETLVIGRLVFTNGKMTTVKTNGMTFFIDHTVISGSVIETVEPNGFNITGSAIIVNSTINDAKDDAFVVYGSLRVENVSVLSGTNKTFVIKGMGSLYLKNVTLNGNLVTVNHRIIRVGADTTGDRMQTSPIISNGTESSEATTIEQTTSTTSAKSTQEIKYTSLSTTVKYSIITFPEDGGLSSTYTASTTDQSWRNDTDPTAISWLGAILGFFLGIGLTLLAFYAFVLFRPKSAHYLYSQICTRGRGDRQELVDWDEEEMTERRSQFLQL